MTTCCSIKERLFGLQENPARPVFPKGQVRAAQIPRPPHPPCHFDVCVAHDSLLSRSPSFLFLLFLWQSWGVGVHLKGWAMSDGNHTGDRDKNPYLENIHRSDSPPPPPLKHCISPPREREKRRRSCSLSDLLSRSCRKGGERLKTRGGGRHGRLPVCLLIRSPPLFCSLLVSAYPPSQTLPFPGWSPPFTFLLVLCVSPLFIPFPL